MLLKPLKPFVPTKLEDVVGCAGYQGPRVTLEEMDAAVASEARKRK